MKFEFSSPKHPRKALAIKDAKLNLSFLSVQGGSLPIGTHKKLAERSLRLQGAAAGRGSLYGVGNAPR